MLVFPKELKPLLGNLLYKGICPPSNALIATPDLDFCPFTPRPEVFPLPDPIPLPTLILVLVTFPVVFNVLPGTYTEQVTIGEIDGTSASNTVTFNPLSAATALANNTILLSAIDSQNRFSESFNNMGSLIITPS